MNYNYGMCPHCGYDGLHGEDCSDCETVVIEKTEKEAMSGKLEASERSNALLIEDNDGLRNRIAGTRAELLIGRQGQMISGLWKAKQSARRERDEARRTIEEIDDLSMNPPGQGTFAAICVITTKAITWVRGER